MTPNLDPTPRSVEQLRADLAKADYLADGATATALWVALKLERPLMLEGPAGVGKTDLARAAAQVLSRPMIRLQCYEGLDEAKALYEWDYAKQMLYTQLLRDAVVGKVAGATSVVDAAARVAESDAAFFSERFLIARPLLAAVRSPTPAVLLIDEVDRSDPEFEAFLLELLSEFQVTIPELGTFRAATRPLVLLTTNATREMTDALRRRCLHAFLDYPSPAREVAILKLRVPGIEDRLAEQLAAFVSHLRALDLHKVPSVSETIDWARAVLLFGARSLDRELVQSTLGALLKHQADRLKVEERTVDLLGAPRPE
jgi:MoxR-like ATPase